MPFLPRLLCPGCGKTIHGVNAKEVPPAEKYEDCLRRCGKCRIGASNAKSQAKVKFYYADAAARPRPEAEPPAEEVAPDAKPEPGTGAGGPPPPERS